jgi:ABC-type polysaccharide/polyol phosphate transport system ATPase subunit
MDIDTEKVIKEVLWKFAGRIKPIGDSSFDEKCLENTDNWKETMVFITNGILSHSTRIFKDLSTMIIIEEPVKINYYTAVEVESPKYLDMIFKEYE